MILDLFIFIDVIGWFAVPHVLLSNKRPVSMLNWILVIVLLPGLGLLLYFLIGTDRMHRRRLQRRYARDQNGKKQPSYEVLVHNLNCRKLSAAEKMDRPRHYKRHDRNC